MKYLQGFDDRMFWQDAQGREYCRLGGGLAWAAGEMPGWLVVLGEDRFPREDGRRHVSVIHAWEARGKEGIASPREIMSEAMALSARLRVHGWIAPGDEADAALVPMFNRERGRQEAKLVLRTPPRYERRTAFAVYDRLLEYRTGTEKTFHFGEAGRGVAQEYSVLRRSDRGRPLGEFPAVAATLYALAWLELTGDGQEESSARHWEVPTVAGY